MQVKFIIFGEPVGKGRPKFTTVQGFAKAYTPKQTASYENLVKLEYAQQCGLKRFRDSDMLDMRIIAYYSIPKSTSKKKRQLMMEHKIRPVKKPDLDNVLKIVADALNEIAYHDDAQIVDSIIRKFYSNVPRVEVTIQNI